MRKVFNKIKSRFGAYVIGLFLLVGLTSVLLGHAPWEKETVRAGGGDWVNYGTTFGERQPQSGSYQVGQTVSAGWNALKPASGMDGEAQPANVEVTINRLTNIWGTDVAKGQAAFSDADVASYAAAGFPNGGYEHALTRVGAQVSGDQNSSNWQLNFNWTATTPGYYQIDITPRGNQARSLGWVAVRVEGAPVVNNPTNPITPVTTQNPQINCTSLVANTSSVRIGDTVSFTPNVTSNQGLGRIEVFVYTTANQSPNSEIGWHPIGTVNSSGQQVYFNNTSSVIPYAGNYVFTMVVYDQNGNRVANWQNGACTTTVNFASQVVNNPNFGQASCEVTANQFSSGSSTNVAFNGRLITNENRFANRYVWNFGDGTSVDTGSNSSTNHTYSGNGTYRPSLTIYDNSGGQWTCSTQVNVNPQIGSSSNCPYTSTQARLAGSTDWDAFKSINAGGSIKVGGFHNDNLGILATDVRIDLTGPATFTNIANGSTVSPTVAGDYTLTVTTPAYSGSQCQGQAVLRVLGGTPSAATTTTTPAQTQTQTQAVTVTQSAPAQPQVVTQAAPSVLPKTGAEPLFIAPILLGLAWVGRKIHRNFKLA